MAGEFEWIDRFFRPLARASSASLNLTDDAAVVVPPAGRDLVMTADSMSAGVHFFADDPPGAIAQKLLRVNLSDLAAMGARPLGYLLTLALPETTDEAWLAGFAGGLASDQAEFSIALFGGDTTRTKGPLCLSLTAVGSVPAGKALKRSGAGVGDEIYVSGTIGDAAMGLKLLAGDWAPADEATRDFLRDRYHLPQPRLALGMALLEKGLASAALDVSDGLVADLNHLAEESGVAAEIRVEAVPFSAVVQRLLGAGAVGYEDLLTGGDDYEILFTVPPDKSAHVARLAAELKLSLSRIGRLAVGKGVEVRERSGRTLSLSRQGWEHF